MNLFFFFLGDSVVQGLWDEKGGWADRVKQDIYSGHLENSVPYVDYNKVYMRAVVGDTSEDLKQRIGKELGDATSHSGSEVNVVFSVGLNDCGRTDGENEVPLDDYRENLKVIIEEARETADTVIAVGLTPVDEERLNEEDSMAFYTNSMVKRYDDVMREVCEEKDVKFIPVFEKLQGDKWTENLFDGLHPNTEGHRKIFELVKDDIKAELNLQHSN